MEKAKTAKKTNAKTTKKTNTKTTKKTNAKATVKAKILKINDKIYEIKNKQRVVNVKSLILYLLAPSIVLLIAGAVLLPRSINLKGEDTKILYNELGNVDYKVYLKENEFYNDTYLDKGMKYVASLITSVKPEFNYELNSTEPLNLTYKYKVDADLIITDVNDPTPLKIQKYNLLEEKMAYTTDNNIKIDEQVDIDYNKYNAYVNEYKKELGLVTSGKLKVYMTVEVAGKLQDDDANLKSKKTLQMTIPLSEQTLDITIDNDNINTTESIKVDTGVKVNNILLFVIGCILTFTGIALLIVALILYNKMKENDPYNKSLRNIFKQYDRLIVNGKYGESDINLDECTTTVVVNKFSELVDAARNEDTSIIWIEKIPGKESIFVVTKDKKAVVFNLTLAWLKAHKRDEWY